MERKLVFILIALFTLSVSAEDVEIDDICYNLISKGNIAEVTGCHHYSGDVVIPEAVTYNDVTYCVTTIRKNAFTGCSLNSIEIPSSITKICKEAFSNGGASTVKIKDLAAWCNINFESYFKTNPLTLASHLFVNDEEIHDLVIPDGVKTITDHAFYYFRGLTSIKIPSSVTSIGFESFASCLGIKTVEIGDSTSQEAATVLGGSVFYKCNNIESVVLGNNIVEIGKKAFEGCNNILSIVIPNSVKTMGTHAFCACENLESVQLSENLKSIEWASFSSCYNLKSIIIPDGVEFIGEMAFAYCTNLTEVKLPSNLNKIDWSAFEGCTGLTSIDIPDNTRTIYRCVFYDCSNLKTVKIGKGVKDIYSGAFAECPALEEIYCMAKTPPTCHTEYLSAYAKTMDVFYDSYIEHATLHAPAKSIETYKTTEPWSKFKTFIPIIIPEHTLTYMVDGEVYKTYSIEEDEEIIAEPELVREGYSFSGWSEIPETMPEHDVTVTGTFTINNYKLTYTVDGEENKSYDLEYGARITPEEEPVKEGYAFSGWSEIPETMPAHDVTITGTFIASQKCSTPIIRYENGQLSFTCDTEGAEFISEITDTDVAQHNSATISLTATYNISVYAKAPNYAASDVAKATLCWIDAAPETEGVIDGTANVRSKAVLIQSHGNILTIQGADLGTSISVFDVTGKKVGGVVVDSETINVATSLMRGQVGIVNINGKSIKVLIK